MGAPVAVAMMVAAGAMSVYSGMRQQKAAKAAAKEQKSIAARNASRIMAESEEEARRAQLSADKDMAKSRAKAGATGVDVAGSSLDIFMGSQEDEWSSQIDWMGRSAGSRASITQAQGNLEAGITKDRGDAALWSGISSGFSQAAGGFK